MKNILVTGGAGFRESSKQVLRMVLPNSAEILTVPPQTGDLA